MIRKLASVTALFLMAHLGMSASYSLVVHKTDGKDEVFVLEKKPVVTFDETDMLITLGENVVIIARSDIKNIDFADVTDGISLHETIGDIIEFIDDNTLRIKTSGIVAVYDLAGVNASASIAIDGEYTIVSVAGCPSGVYIINYNDKSLKIIKK